MVEELRSGGARYVTSISVLVVTLAVIGFGVVGFLPRQTDTANLGISSLKDLAQAYVQVKPGTTRASQLARLGFDTANPSVHMLSYLGVMERFMARDSVAFDRLDTAVQDCIEARDRCTALVFDRGETRVRAAGMLSIFGVDAAKADEAPAEVTLLVQDGRVAYKTIRGVTLPIEHHAAVAVRAVPHAIAAAVQPAAFRTTY